MRPSICQTLIILILAGAAGLAIPTRAFAQHLIGHAVTGIAGTAGFVNGDPTPTVAGGGAFVIGDRLSLGGEAGLLGGLVMLTGNASLRMPSHRDALPFVTAGVSRVGVRYGDGTFSTLNVGGGVDLWFKPRAAVRLEVLDQVRPDDRGATHYWSLRAGIAFR